MPDEKLEDHLNIKELLAKKRNEEYTSVWRVPMKKRLGESPEDYVNLYDDLTKKKHHKE